MNIFPPTVTHLYILMEEFKEDATKEPRLILRELDRVEDDDIRERIMSLARDAVDYPPISAWYTEIMTRAALRYAKRRAKELEDEEAAILENERSE